MKDVKKEKKKLVEKTIFTPDKNSTTIKTHQKEGSNIIPYITKLLEKLLSSGKEQVHDICFFMLNTGFRFTEIIDIKFSDIDFTTATLKIGVAKSSLPKEEKVNIKLNHKSLTLLAKIRDQYPNNTWVFQAKNSNKINKKPRSLSRQVVINTIKQANQYLEQKLSFPLCQDCCRLN
ncbi:MAG: site-specific integrase [Colwellia sp.]|nr:site-specific integrase [Colwellia sp.]